MCWVYDVRTTFAFKSLLIFLIPLTFAWKLVPEHQPPQNVQGSVTRFLTTHEFHVTEQTPTDSVLILRATKGNCSMIVAEASPDSATRYAMRHLATTLDQRFVVFGGEVSGEQPTWLTLAQVWWTKFLHKIGISMSDPVPIMVAANYSCNARRLPWGELASGG